MGLVFTAHEVAAQNGLSPSTRNMSTVTLAPRMC
jgi:hypothetical protein